MNFNKNVLVLTVFLMAGSAFANSELASSRSSDHPETIKDVVIPKGAFANNQLTGLVIPDSDHPETVKDVVIPKGAFANNQLTDFNVDDFTVYDENSVSVKLSKEIGTINTEEVIEATSSSGESIGRGAMRIAIEAYFGNGIKIEGVARHTDSNFYHFIFPGTRVDSSVTFNAEIDGNTHLIRCHVILLNGNKNTKVELNRCTDIENQKPIQFVYSTHTRIVVRVAFNGILEY